MSATVLHFKPRLRIVSRGEPKPIPVTELVACASMEARLDDLFAQFMKRYPFAARVWLYAVNEGANGE